MHRKDSKNIKAPKEKPNIYPLNPCRLVSKSNILIKNKKPNNTWNCTSQSCKGEERKDGESFIVLEDENEDIKSWKDNWISNKQDRGSWSFPKGEDLQNETHEDP